MSTGLDEKKPELETRKLELEIQKLEVDLKRANIEQKKLDAEVESLKRNPFLSPQGLGAVSAVLSALVSLVAMSITYRLADPEMKALKAEKSLLVIENTELKNKAMSLSGTVVEREAKIEALDLELESSRKSAEEEKLKLHNEITLARNTHEVKLQEFKDQIDKLTEVKTGILQTNSILLEEQKQQLSTYNAMYSLVPDNKRDDLTTLAKKLERQVHNASPRVFIYSGSKDLSGMPQLESKIKDNFPEFKIIQGGDTRGDANPVGQMTIKYFSPEHMIRVNELAKRLNAYATRISPENADPVINKNTIEIWLPR